MSAKRNQDESEGAQSAATSSRPAKRQRAGGFQVGPANLPDGTRRRRAQKIKKGLIDRAKVKRSYAKLREHEAVQPSNVHYDDDGHQQLDDDRVEREDEEQKTDDVSSAAATGQSSQTPASLEPHPDRQRLILGRGSVRGDGAEVNGTALEGAEDQQQDEDQSRLDRRRRSKPKAQPFSRQQQEAQRRQQEAEERTRQREESRIEREHKLEERERFRRQMAKARTGGKNGQRKLGRESKVLLAKVKRLMGEA